MPRYKVFRLGNLGRLHWHSELELRRGITTFQLMTILEEAHHSLIIVEHDPMLYEDAQEMTEYISKALRQASHEATVLLYSSGIDTFLEDMTKLADRVFYFEEGPRESPKLTAKTWQKMKNQRTMVAFSLWGLS